MKFSIEDFFSKCDQIRTKLPIWSHLLKKSLTENFIFCAVSLMANFNLISAVYFLGTRSRETFQQNFSF